MGFKKFTKFHIFYYIFFLLAIQTPLFSQPVFIKKARELVGSGHFTDAISYLKSWENVRLLDSDKAELYQMEGEIYLYYLKLYDEAIKSYQKALSYAPPMSSQYLQSFFGMAQAYMKKGEPEEAVKILQNLENLYRNRPELASINYMLQEAKKKVRLKEQAQRQRKRKQKARKPERNTLKLPLMVRVKIGEGTLDQIGTTSGGTITITLPSGITDTYTIPTNIKIRQFPHGTIFRITPTGGFLLYRGRKYRGSFILTYKGKSRMAIINYLPLDDYLKGVLPWEISPRWPMEAIKAQAVAARTYALYHILQNNEYDLESTILSQVYKGASIEHPRTNEAIKITRNEVLVYNGMPILAYFHSCNGGFREIPENVWGIKLPYFKQGIDPWCLKKPQYWKATLTMGEITRKLKKAYPFIGKISGLSLQKDRITVKYVILKTSSGNKIKIKVNDFRLLVGPTLIRSGIFDITRHGNRITFKGRGYGHGVGLSQWGAYYMAKAGKNYLEILSFYYPGTRITTIDRLRLPLSLSRAFP